MLAYVDYFSTLQFTKKMVISLEKIKELKNMGHSIDSIIKLLEKKAEMKRQNRHWFIFSGGRNICEFCGVLYRFRDNSICNPDSGVSRRTEDTAD